MEIKINYIWDYDLAIKSAQDIYQYELKNSNKKYIGWMFVAMLQFGVVGALKHNAYGFLVIATIGLIYWYGLRWPLRKYFIIKTFQKSPLANKPVSLTAKKDGIYASDQLQIKYEDIKKAVVLDDAIVIYHPMGTSYIPNNGFESTKDRNKLIKLIS